MIRPGGRWRTAGTWVLLTLGLGMTFAIGRTLIVASLLVPEDLGTVAIALLVLGLVETLTGTGMDTALVTTAGDIEPDLDPAFTLQAMRGAGVAALLCLFAPAVGWWFANDDVVPVVYAVSAIAALRGLVNPASYLLDRRFEFRRVFWWRLPEMVVNFGLAAGLAMLWRDLMALVVAAVAAQAVATAASYGMAPRRPRIAIDWPRIGRLLHYGKWVGGARMLMHLSVTSDALVVGSLLGTRALGLYQFASRIAELPVVTFTRAVGIVSLPGFTERQARPVALRNAYRAALAVALGINSAVALVVLSFGEVAVVALVGERWRPAVTVLRILSVAMVFRAVLIVSSQYFDAARRPQLTVRVNIVRLGVLLVGVVPLATALGMNGAALSVLFSSVAAAAACLWLTRGIGIGEAGPPQATGSAARSRHAADPRAPAPRV